MVLFLIVDANQLVNLFEMQGCALVALGDLLLPLGDKEILVFALNMKARHPGLPRF